MSSIYVHVPWCRRRCPYCDFYLVVGSPNINFIDALILEWQKRNDAQVAKTLYFGGGTPSLLKPLEIARFIENLFDKKALALDAEITIEANPEDITKEYAESLKDTPINRISLGVQSLDNEVLRFLGRKHDEEQARNSILRLKDAGFNNISVDQIIGVPEEKIDKILSDIEWLSFVPHLSCYLLTIEDGTNFSKRIKSGIIPNVDDDKQADTYQLVQKSLSDKGFIQYDISSYAKPGFFSRHNQTYWGQGEYLGLGAGAHSLRFLPGGGIERLHNATDLKAWLKDPTDDRNYIIDKLGPKKAFREALAFGFRNMAVGVNPCHVAARFNQKVPKSLGPVLQKFKDLGWLEEREGHFMLSPKGALYGDAIMREVLFI